LNIKAKKTEHRTSEEARLFKRGIKGRVVEGRWQKGEEEEGAETPSSHESRWGRTIWRRENR
jgi:hypothetical protein